jgi:hypothetical protein
MPLIIYEKRREEKRREEKRREEKRTSWDVNPCNLIGKR